MSKYTPINRDYKNLPSQNNRIASPISSKYWALIATGMGLVVGAITLFSLNTPLTPIQTPQISITPHSTIEEPALEKLAALESTTMPTTTSTSDSAFTSTIASTSAKTPVPAKRKVSLALPQLNESKTNIDQLAPNSKYWRTVKVRKGDNLARIFSRLELDPTLLHRILSSGKKARRLRHLKPGQKIKFLFTDSEFTSLIHEISKTKHIRIDKKGTGFVATDIKRIPESRITHATGEITSSLFRSAKKAGLSENLIMDMANIFGWDIDFALDLRKGDSFIVAYEELFLDGEKISNGNIVAAEFINDQKTFRAVSYTDPARKTGYYTPEGRNMRKAFLRSPVDFTRISSRFGKRRHPILNRMRLHKGVDYAAPRGTPIRTTGDGKIIFKGRKGGYGKTIIVQHGSGKETLYAHMSGYKRGIKRGKHVKQGQTIGFVGSTGRTTGPHLHYEFRINDVHRNPLKLKFASAKPVPKKFKDDFNYKTSEYIALLDVLGNRNVALTSYLK